MANYYVAIDDTDRAEDDGRNQGTGSKSRALARELRVSAHGAAAVHRSVIVSA